MIYTHTSRPQADRPKHLIRRPDPLRDGWIRHPNGRKVYARDVTGAELVDDGWIVVQDKPDTGHDPNLQRVTWTGIGDDGVWIYEVVDLTPEELAARRSALKDESAMRAEEHQRTFCRQEDIGVLIAFWMMVDSTKDPDWIAEIGPYQSAIQGWIKSIWDQHAANQAAIDVGQEPNMDYAALGTLPFSFGGVRQAVYSRSTANLPSLG